MRWVYDIETYPNVFLCTIVREDGQHLTILEISEFRNDVERFFKMVDYLEDNEIETVGFNNINFDYPVLHDIIKIRHKLPAEGKAIAKMIYVYAQAQIDSVKKSDFPRTIKEAEWKFPQVDLMKIWHFDNMAKRTSLKKLEFNMRSETIEELPFPVGTILTEEQVQVLRKYNVLDVTETLKFYKHTLPHINFRAELSKKYGRNFMNHNDTKIGKDYFIMRLEENGIKTSSYVNGKRVLAQTPRNVMKLEDAIFDYYDFKRPEFQAVLQWFKNQRISETKGVFTEIKEHRLGDVAKYAKMRERSKKLPGKPGDATIMQLRNDIPAGWVEEITLRPRRKGDVNISYWKCWNEADNLNVVVNDFEYVFGTGGIHGSVSNRIVSSTATHKLLDADVSSQYPNVAISNRVYPQHLTAKFCDIYKDVYDQRKSFAKGTPENQMLKLALNGVYGDSNNKYSPFYDPLYTMKITINGQLSLCLLAEYLMEIEGLEVIQINTDGITVLCPRDKEDQYKAICDRWQKHVKLELEFAEYEKMFIRDVNNYIALYTNGKVKRKGAYEYDQFNMVGSGWHTDLGGLVIRKAAEAFLLHGTPVEDFILNHKDVYDFMMRVVLPKNADLVLVLDDGTEVPQQNVLRYYPSTSGGELIKILPPKTVDGPNRRIGVCSGIKVKTCNNMLDFDGTIDYSYYIAEAKKLLVGQAEAVIEVEKTEEEIAKDEIRAKQVVPPKRVDYSDYKKD